ncbi:uncharacterized protein UDID_18429 [Ustilago sp. UG-2017a]|nr:uncharacterized protein UDID_18429 [Ustilago sp. UG-2017a]
MHAIAADQCASPSFVPSMERCSAFALIAPSPSPSLPPVDHNAVAILSVLLPPPFALRHLFVTRHPAPSLAYRISSADGAQFSLRRALILQSPLKHLPAASRCDRYSSTIPEIALVTFPTKLPAASLLPPPAR